MSLEIKVGAIREPEKLLLSKRKIELGINASFRIVSAITIGNLYFVNLFLGDSELFQKIHLFVKKFVEGFIYFIFIARVDEVFYFHLFKFTKSENKVAGGNLVSKSLAD